MPTKVVDSPLADVDTDIEPEHRFCVMWKATDDGMERPWITAEGNQAFADNAADAHRLRTDALKFIDRKSGNGKLAAVSLRVYRSDKEEL